MNKEEKKILLGEMQAVYTIADLARMHGITRQAMHQRIQLNGLMSYWKRRAKKQDARLALKERMSKAGRAGVGECKSRKKFI